MSADEEKKKKKRPAPQTAQELFDAGAAAYDAHRFKTALRLFLKAAEMDHPDAAYRCSLMYERGEGTPKDTDKALGWCVRAADLGHEEAQSTRPHMRAMFAEARREIAEGRRLFSLGSEAYGAGEYEKALSLFEQAAALGNADAQFNCGVMVRNGQGTEADGAKALAWFEKAGWNGCADAAFNCGVLYMRGEGTRPNKRKGRMWFRVGVGLSRIQALERASNEQYAQKLRAEREEAERLFAQGAAAYRRKDAAAALSLFERAAELGDVDAQYNCGAMYAAGKGAPADPEKARKWLEKAAAQEKNRTAQQHAKKLLHFQSVKKG